MRRYYWLLLANQDRKQTSGSEAIQRRSVGDPLSYYLDASTIPQPN